MKSALNFSVETNSCGGLLPLWCDVETIFYNPSLRLHDSLLEKSGKCADSRHDFTARRATRSFHWQSFMIAVEDFLMNDTLMIKARVWVLNVTTPLNNIEPAGPIDKFESYFTSLEEFINAVETNGVRAGWSSRNRILISASENSELRRSQEG